MIEKKGIHTEYLFKYKEGKIQQGLGLDCGFDDYLRFKRRQLCIILGHDNVGKTYWMTWYFLTLAMKHDLKFCVWSGENSTAKLIRDMIQMLSGVRFSQLENSEILRYMAIIEAKFDFVDDTQLYKPNDLLRIFEDSGADACLIDPFTGLDRDMEWKENYKFLNDCRHFTNRTNKTIYICTHPISSAGRQNNYYPENHMWAGHLRPPTKDDVEGGKAFLNRSDDVIIVHRLVKHPEMYKYTLVSIDKVKDVETGGRQTMKDEPLLFDFNRGLGFEYESKDLLVKVREKHNKKIDLWTN